MFLFSPGLFEDYRNLIGIKTIHISRTKTILDLKRKIIRSLNGILREKDGISFETHEINIILPFVKNSKERFELIFALTTSNSSVQLEGELIEDDSLVFEVKF